MKPKLLRHCGLLIGALLVVTTAMAQAEPDATALLAASDIARGGGSPGLTWDISIRNSGSQVDDDEVTKLVVKATSHNSVAEIYEPIRSKGSKILQVDRNMWITKPGLRKPVAISPRQRLTGQASIGDIAATDYAHDYTPQYLRTDTINGERCYVLELTAARQNTTYDRIVYWISDSRRVGVHADFMSVSGKRIKRADFVYDNRIAVNGKSQLFVSRMTIQDELTDAKSVLDFSKIRVGAVSASEFDVGNIQ
jgi:hypothetical protein